MSAEPLTREERDTFLREDGFARNHPTRMEEYRRYEATVQAAEERAEDWMRRAAVAVERAEAAEERAERLRTGIYEAMKARGPFGQFLRTQVCPACRGAGEVPAQPCASCQGSGRTPSVHLLQAIERLSAALAADDAARGDQ